MLVDFEDEDDRVWKRKWGIYIASNVLYPILSDNSMDMFLLCWFMKVYIYELCFFIYVTPQ